MDLATDLLRIARAATFVLHVPGLATAFSLGMKIISTLQVNKKHGLPHNMQIMKPCTDIEK